MQQNFAHSVKIANMKDKVLKQNISTFFFVILGGDYNIYETRLKIVWAQSYSK